MDPHATAMVFEEVKKPFSAYTLPLPETREGEILVRIDYTTICTSDLHTYFGRRTSPCPSILGHEITGAIVRLGTGEHRDHSGTPLQIGDRITWAVYAYDPKDPMAQRGMPQKSASLYKYGHESLQGAALNGGFASHCLLKKGTHTYLLPKALNKKEGAPLNCSHATMAGAIRLAGDLTDRTVAIIGAGMLGLSGCAMAREKGASHVVAIDLDENRSKKALDFGADIVIHTALSEVDRIKQIEAIGGLDVVIDTSGQPSAIEQGISLLRTGGRCIIVGAVYTQRNLSINAERIVRHLLTLKGLHNYIPEDLEDAVRFLEKHHQKYDFGSLVDQEFPLSRLDEAFELADRGGHYRIGIYPS